MAEPDCFLAPALSFRAEWVRLEDAGQVDDWGGAQRRRILDAWLSAGAPQGVRAFILAERGDHSPRDIYCTAFHDQGDWFVYGLFLHLPHALLALATERKVWGPDVELRLEGPVDGIVVEECGRFRVMPYPPTLVV